MNRARIAMVLLQFILFLLLLLLLPPLLFCLVLLLRFVLCFTITIHSSLLKFTNNEMLRVDGVTEEFSFSTLSCCTTLQPKFSFSSLCNEKKCQHQACALISFEVKGLLFFLIQFLKSSCLKTEPAPKIPQHFYSNLSRHVVLS